jgi:glycosyltransferase involved in cell wall biosynthesis
MVTGLRCSVGRCGHYARIAALGRQCEESGLNRIENAGSGGCTGLMDHTFAIPVYRTAPNLAPLIDSLRAQTGAHSEILLASSTPSAELEAFAKRHDLPLYINPQRIDIAADWNFALATAQTAFVTLAHQDDLFAPPYVAQLRNALHRHPGSLFAFCDYSEHTPLGARPTNINLSIKRVLRRRAFGTRECIVEPRDKVRLLSFGNPICCPSVMLNRSMLADFRFPDGFRTNLDWMAWLDLARRPGGFVYVRERLVSKGVHAGSETTATIASRAREREDRALFDTLWPRPVAAALATLYKFGYRANRF